MEFSHVDNDRIYFKAKMTRCRGCGEFMLETQYMNLPRWNRDQLQGRGVRICTNDIGICETCYKESNYPIQCSICKHYKKFPGEFKYKTVEYAEYGEGDSDSYSICIDCVAKRPQDVIKLLAASDETETYN